MAGFTKLFNSILDSTIWQEPNETRLLWITMLAMCDARGEVQSSIPGLAKRAGITIEECESGLLTLSEPDRYSRTKDHEGRRIAQIDGGWRLLNHGRYREILSAEERREYNRKKQAEWRAARQTPVNDMSMTVNHNKQCQHITEAEAEADSRLQNKEEEEEAHKCAASPPSPKFEEVLSFANSQPRPISSECTEAFFDEMESLEWTYKGRPCVTRSAWQGRFRKWATSWHNNLHRAGTQANLRQKGYQENLQLP